MSPGTRSRRGSSRALPSRTTVAVTWIMAFSFAAAASARASWRKRKAALSTTIPAMTLPARGSPVAKEIEQSTASRITRGLRRMIRSRRNQPRRRSCATTFGPVFRARPSASASVRPSLAVRSERSSSSPSLPAASRTAGETWILGSFAFGGSEGWRRRSPPAPPPAAECSTASSVWGVVIVPLTDYPSYF